MREPSPVPRAREADIGEAPDEASGRGLIVAGGRAGPATPPLIDLTGKSPERSRTTPGTDLGGTSEVDRASRLGATTSALETDGPANRRPPQPLCSSVSQDSVAAIVSSSGRASPIAYAAANPASPSAAVAAATA